jgi:hypothetical protein
LVAGCHAPRSFTFAAWPSRSADQHSSSVLPADSNIDLSGYLSKRNELPASVSKSALFAGPEIADGDRLTIDEALAALDRSFETSFAWNRFEGRSNTFFGPGLDREERQDDTRGAV